MNVKIKKLSILFASIFYINSACAIDLNDLISGKNLEYQTDDNNEEVNKESYIDKSFKINNENPMVARLNSIRSNFGLPPLNKNYALSNAAYSHAGYLIDKPTPSHYQTEGDPMFTGSTPLERAIYAGYNKGKLYVKVGEVVAMYNGRQQQDDLNNFLVAIYHRLAILNPTFNDYGEIRISNGVKNISEIKLGTTYEDDEIHYTYYPYNNMKETPTLFLPYQENPNPMPEYKTVGYPISFQISDGNKLKINDFSLKDSAGNLTDGKIFTSETDKEVKESQFAFIPFSPLKNNEIYYVSLSGNANGGSNFKKEWSFTTENKKEPVITTDKPIYYPNEIATIFYDNVNERSVKMEIKTYGGSKLLLQNLDNGSVWGVNRFKILSGCKSKNGCVAVFTLNMGDGKRLEKKFKIMQ